MAELVVLVWQNEKGELLVPSDGDFYEVNEKGAKEAVEDVQEQWLEEGLKPHSFLKETEENFGNLLSDEIEIAGVEFSRLVRRPC